MPIEAPQRESGKAAQCSRSLQENATDNASTEQRYLLSPRAHVISGHPDVTPAFLAPNKSPNKSRVFSKLSS
jgi:hypothetical protein